MSRPFKKNYHVARRQRIEKIRKLIEFYPKQFAPPKYLVFMEKMMDAGWIVKLHKVGVSKYIFVEKGDNLFKIRFSNHKPLYNRELENDCDFYVGISHTQVSTTEKVLEKLLSIA